VPLKIHQCKSCATALWEHPFQRFEREKKRERYIYIYIYIYIGHAEKQVRNQLIDCQQLQQWQIVFTIFQMYFKQQEAHGVPVESRSERLGKLLWVFISLSLHMSHFYS
jgi:hypothetical protein